MRLAGVYWSEGKRRSVTPNGKLPELVCESDEEKSSVVGRRRHSWGGASSPVPCPSVCRLCVRADRRPDTQTGTQTRFPTPRIVSFPLGKLNVLENENRVQKHKEFPRQTLDRFTFLQDSTPLGLAIHTFSERDFRFSEY